MNRHALSWWEKGNIVPPNAFAWFLLFVFSVLCHPLLAPADSLSALSVSDFAALSPLLQLELVFVAGFLSSLTPCVYPLIPITLAIFGATGEISRYRAFFLALLYVLGIAVTYTALGLVSAFTGALFGSFLGNPVVVSVGVLLLVLLSLSSLDMLSLDFLRPLRQKADTIGGKGLMGAFLMGTVSGVIAAPCIGPVLVVLLGFAAASQSPVWGGTLLFVYSLGLGVLFILLGTFSGLISKIPRSGGWLVWVKFIMASAILMVAVYLAASFREPFGLGLEPATRLYILLALSAAAIALAAVAMKTETKILKFASAVLLAFALYEAIVPAVPQAGISGSSAPQVKSAAWLTSLDAAISQAKKRNSIAMLDLFAEWCGACKELDTKTFPNSQVQELLKNVVAARIDFTTESEESSKIQEQFTVIGLPCILFLSADGKEMPNSRITGFMPPEEFFLHVQKVLAAASLR